MTRLQTQRIGGRLTALLIASSGVLFSQSSAVGHIAGKVTGPDGSPIANQVVILETPRGNREFATDEKGQFRIPNLVPGRVVVKVNARDMMDFRAEVLVMVNQLSTLNISLRRQAAQTVEVIDVDTSVPLNTTDSALAKTGYTTTMDQVDNLPIPQGTGTDRLSGILTLVPGTSDGYAYHGASTLAYHVDGVDTTDSNWGKAGTQLNNDLIDQVQMLTGGVSAKFGRFDGGLVSVTTKSGTNEFEGSARFNLSNPKWDAIGKTPEIYKALGIPMAKRKDGTTAIQSYTFMGPILKDKVFFSLGYQTYSPAQRTYMATTGLAFGSVPYTSTTSQTRKDLKLDWIVDNANRLAFQYNAVKDESSNGYTNLGMPSSLATLSGLKRTETGYYSLGWTSQLASNLLLDVKYNDAFSKIGGAGTGSPGGDSVVSWLDVPDRVLFDNGTFSNAKDERHQKVISAGITWFAFGMGEHQVDAGVQHYTYTLESAALDYPSGFLISFNGFSPNAPTPALGYRILESAPTKLNLTNLVWQQPVQGKATNKNLAVYLNDTWSIDKNISVNLGLRFDQFTSDTVPENNHYSTSAFAPRLAFNYDLKGDKTDVFSVTAAEYAAQILQGNLAGASVTKTPITRTYRYVGTGGANQGLGSDALTATGAINWAAWGNLQGATGKDAYVSLNDPIQNRTTFVDPNLKAPRTREVTLGYRHEVLKQAFTATLIRRWMDRFVDDIWYGNGIKAATATAPGVAKVIISNDPDGKADYYALEMTYRNNQFEGLSFGGNATWSRSIGNSQTQANNFGNGIDRSQLAPNGPSFPIDRPVVIHADVSYQHSLGKGTWNAALLGSYFGQETYGFRWGTAATPGSLVNQGYAATYRRFFPELGPLHQPEYYTLDMQVGYTYPFTRKIKAFAKMNVINLMNYMPNISNTYYGVVAGSTYVPIALFDGKGTVNVGGRSLKFDLGMRF